MMTLCTKPIKAGKRMQSCSHELVLRDPPILVLVHDAQHRVHDMVSLLLVRNLVGRLLLRVGMVYAVDSLNFVALKETITVITCNKYEPLAD